MKYLCLVIFIASRRELPLYLNLWTINFSQYPFLFLSNAIIWGSEWISLKIFTRAEWMRSVFLEKIGDHIMSNCRKCRHFGCFRVSFTPPCFFVRCDPALSEGVPVHWGCVHTKNGAISSGQITCIFVFPLLSVNVFQLRAEWMNWKQEAVQILRSACVHAAL